MRFRAIRLKLIPLVVLTATFGLFQNCGQTLRPGGGDTTANSTHDDQVVDMAAKYDQITFDPLLETNDVWGNSPSRLDIDLQSGTLEIQHRTTNKTVSCTLDADRLSALRQIMSSAQICKPGPLPPNTAVCLAIALADIRLTNANGADTVDLRQAMCYSGTFLCGDADQKLRDLLLSVRNQVPAGCN